MSKEKELFNSTREMRSIVTKDEVAEFVRLAQNQESKHDQIANDLENAAKSDYLDSATRSKMLEAAGKERHLANKWNALWAVFDRAEFHRID